MSKKTEKTVKEEKKGLDRNDMQLAYLYAFWFFSSIFLLIGAAMWPAH